MDAISTAFPKPLPTSKNLELVKSILANTLHVSSDIRKDSNSISPYSNGLPILTESVSINSKVLG